MADWNPLQSPQNKIVLAGKPSPGYAEVSGASLQWRIDVRKVNGMMGGILVWTGRELSPFSVKLYLRNTQDWADWHAWKGLVLAKPDLQTGLAGATVAKALDIQHPQLEDAGIRACIVTKVYQPVPNGDTGEWAIQIDFLEFRGAPKQLQAKVEGEQATPEDPVDREIKNRLAQAKDLYEK